MAVIRKWERRTAIRKRTGPQVVIPPTRDYHTAAKRQAPRLHGSISNCSSPIWVPLLRCVRERPCIWETPTKIYGGKEAQCLRLALRRFRKKRREREQM